MPAGVRAALGVGDAEGDGASAPGTSRFVKYDDVFVCWYQSGAALSLVGVPPSGCTLQNSSGLPSFSRVKAIILPSGAKIGSTSCPELSVVSWRKNFPSSRYR